MHTVRTRCSCHLEPSPRWICTLLRRVLPHREWQYAWTRPLPAAHHSNANSVLDAFVMVTLNCNRWWYPRTQRSANALGRGGSRHRRRGDPGHNAHSDLQSLEILSQPPDSDVPVDSPSEALRSPTIPGHLGMSPLCSDRRQHRLSGSTNVQSRCIRTARTRLRCPQLPMWKWIGRPPGQPLVDEIRARGGTTPGNAV